jgi:amphi-Trp domain-containing protein
MSAKPGRDVEANTVSANLLTSFARLADSLESGKPFEIQIAGERIYVPARAEFSVEHERGGKEEEIEFQLKWTND